MTPAPTPRTWHESPAWAAALDSPAMDGLRLLAGLLAVAAEVARTLAAEHPAGACRCPYCSALAADGLAPAAAELLYLARDIDRAAAAVAAEGVDPPALDGDTFGADLRTLAGLSDRADRTR